MIAANSLRFSRMKPSLLFPVLLAALTSLSCDQSSDAPTPPEAPKEEKAYSLSVPTWGDTEYTRWMTRAELQYHQEMLGEGKYFAYVEGRDNQGLSEFRAVEKDFAEDEFTQWAVFWGIDDKELFDWELRLLKGGFQRESMQVFFDSLGNPVHQIVWLRPVGAIDNVPETPPQPEVVIVAPPIEEEPKDELVEINPVEQTPTELPDDGPPPAVERRETTSPPIIEETPKAIQIYTVVPGDTLSRIASKHKTTVAALKKDNGLKSDILRIGQKLKL